MRVHHVHVNPQTECLTFKIRDNDVVAHSVELDHRFPLMVTGEVLIDEIIGLNDMTKFHGDVQPLDCSVVSFVVP